MRPMLGVEEHRVTVNYDIVPSHSKSYRVLNSLWKVVFYSLGIFVSYAVFGLLQEQLLRRTFGPDKEQFNFFISLLVLQCVVNAGVARVLICLFDLGVDHTALSFYLAGSGCYSGGLAASAFALRYVNYPTQIVAKSAKPLPVMVLGILFSKRRYSLQKAFCVLLIVAGVALFMYEDQQDAAAIVPGSTWYGDTLLITSLIADGLLCVVQDRMQLAYETKALHMMFQHNFISIFYLAVVLVLSQEAQPFVEFVGKYPQLYGELMLFTLTSAIGQLFIFSTIVDFGPLMCAIITTVRKFFTVLFSVLLFGTEISVRQWFAAIVVFSGIILDATTA